MFKRCQRERGKDRRSEPLFGLLLFQSMVLGTEPHTGAAVEMVCSKDPKSETGYIPSCGSGNLHFEVHFH